MPTEKYTRVYLRTQLPAEIREHRREDRLDPTKLPSYDYLNKKGFETRGLSKAIQRHFDEDMTLHEFLREQGFGYQKQGEWPTTHQRTIRLLNGYRDSRKKRNNDKPDTTSTLESALRGVLRTMQDVHGIDNLLMFFEYEAHREETSRTKQLEAVLDKIKNDWSGGGAQNYIRYLKEFYDYVITHTEHTENPVRKVLWQYDFDTTPEKEIQSLNGKQIKRLWTTIKQLPDRHDRCESVENLTSRYGIKKWQTYMMALLVFCIAVGPRTKDIVRTDCRENLNFGDDPYVYFPLRKNQPSEVPILARPEFLEAYCDYLDYIHANWNGKLFPSEQSHSGSRSPPTLNHWLRALAEEANIRLDDGSLPTLQNLRQTWQNRYMEVLRKSDVHLKLVADDAGTKTERIVKNRYWSDIENRKSIRDLVTNQFDDYLPLDGLPESMSNVLDQADYVDYQQSLDEY